ncbi:MAG TPA: thioredoxin domain-containing protein [Syntrophomonadaceae bacterium]|nr:thioredoxin domain-containing protein [Syntrophomonadaceae bacterium]
MSEQNHLINEKSPYLLQHAHDPVDWYPWGEAAFQEAKSNDIPIFLSIGYSSCHWCHVMHEESFQDPTIANILNQQYLAIKVDREERPDVDSVYMSVCQALTGQGGWPLTIIMTPDREPFFAATYLPPGSRRGMTGLLELLPQIRKMWDGERDTLLQAGEKIGTWLKASQDSHQKGDVSQSLLHSAFNSFEHAFDHDYGGFRSAPKFPSPHNLFFLLRYYHSFDSRLALNMVEKTLEGMYRGGLYDHLGFGFARYSTDRRWLVPHFEKMLYDNALLAMAYLEAYQVTGKDLYRRVAEGIFTYLLRDMRSPEGGFYSAEDADSEGGEGVFYLWTPEQVKAVLGEEADHFCSIYGIKPGGNFEGASIPNLLKGLPDSSQERRMNSLREQLRTERDKRPRPQRDDKILCSWNGLVIAALALGARVLGRELYLEAARKALDFILTRMRREDGRLLARFREGEARYPAYADDYAFLIWACIELYETCYDQELLEWAGQLNDDMIQYFWDETTAGFFFYGWDAEQLIGRPKELYDAAMPSANSVAALNLLRLARLTGREDLEEKAEKQIVYFAGSVASMPEAYAFYLCALSHYLDPGTEIKIIGPREAEETGRMIKEVWKDFRPYVLTFFQEEAPESEYGSLEGYPSAYVCSNRSCRAPVTSSSELRDLLTES